LQLLCYEVGLRKIKPTDILIFYTMIKIIYKIRIPLTAKKGSISVEEEQEIP